MVRFRAVVSVRKSAPFERRGVALAACVALSLVPVATAGAQDAPEPHAPGNLIANGGFDTDLSGWGSFGGTLTRVDEGYGGGGCAPNGGEVSVRQQTGSVYTISDSQGGYQPTVRSTVAGETYIAYAVLRPTSESATGKPARFILRERVGTTGAILKETATAFTMPNDVGYHMQPLVSATTVRSGSTLGLRIEQSNAQPGDSFAVDNIFLRRATRAFGADAPGAIWTTISNDISRVSTYSALDANGQPDTYARYLDRLRVYLDGRGGATGSQKLRAVMYDVPGPDGNGGRIGVSGEVTIVSGSSARWVDFRFGYTPLLYPRYGATYRFGLLSGPTRNVARYASTRQPGALLWGPDSYANGPNQYFGTTDPGGLSPAWSTDDKQMSIQGIAAPLGRVGRLICWG